MTLPLARRIRSGVSWNISSALLTQVINFVRSIILARLLAPEDFGLFAMALTVVAALTAVSTLGLNRTIIAKQFESPDDQKSHLDTVWTLEILRSLLITSFVTVTALLVAHFYNQPQLKLIIPVLGVSTLLQGFQNIGLFLLRKEIRFKTIFWFELVSNSFALATALILTIYLRNVWALAFSLVASAGITTVLSYVFHPYRPHFKINRQAAQHALQFGKMSLVIAAALYVMNMADNVMVGKMLGAGALGNYSLAFNIASTPISVLAYSIGAVLFPAYAEITTRPIKTLELAFTKVFTLSLLLMVTIAVPLFLVANELVQFLFGNKWTSAGAVLRILAVVIPLRALSTIISSVFWGLNRPKDVATATSIEAAVFVVALYPLIKTFGSVGAAWAGFVAYAVGSVVRIRVLSKVVPGISSRLVYNTLYILLAGVIGLLAANASLTMVSSTLPRIVLGGLLSTLIPLVLLLSIKTDWRNWIVELFS